jgi:hypothetical protein
MHRILAATLKTQALTGSLALLSLSLFQSCRGNVQESSPATINSPTAVPTVPDVLNESPGKAPPQRAEFTQEHRS